MHTIKSAVATDLRFLNICRSLSSSNPIYMTRMSAGHYAYVEQDQDLPTGGNELPTYDDLAVQNGPNSR